MEDPAGASPWASSPEASRPCFTGDVPRDELPAPAVQSQYQYSQESTNEQQDLDYNSQQAQEGGWSSEQQSRWPQQQQQTPFAQPQARSPMDENRRPQSARYHNVAQTQRQHAPQYKLQAKITGLERTGKKDSILRFDVYVRLGTVLRIPWRS